MGVLLIQIVNNIQNECMKASGGHFNIFGGPSLFPGGGGPKIKVGGERNHRPSDGGG